MLTQELLKKYLSYDPKTGNLTWLQETSVYHRRVGKVAGVITQRGYIDINFFRYRYKAHRLIWLYMTGKWPKNEIDHINGNTRDNKWENLREATHSQNSKNYSKPVNNISGYKGVSWKAKNKKFVAQIMVDGIKYHIGVFDDPKEAYRAYCEMAIQCHGEFAKT